MSNRVRSTKSTDTLPDFQHIPARDVKPNMMVAFVILNKTPIWRRVTKVTPKKGTIEITTVGEVQNFGPDQRVMVAA